MAAPDPAPHGPWTPKDQHERFIAVLCRDARLQNEKIHKKRQKLRKELRIILEQAYDTEGLYWHGYHQRLGEIIERKPNAGTSSWAASFGHNERHFLDEVEKRQAQLHEDAQRKQDELVAVNREFWGAWRKHVDFMRGLPTSSGSTSAAMVPDVAPQPTDDQTGCASSASHSNGDRKQGDLNTESTTGQKQSASGKPSTASIPLPKLSTTTTQAGKAQDHSLGQNTKGPKGKAMQAAPSTSRLAAPTPLSLVSSPEPNISASVSVSKPRRRLSSFTASASPGKSSVPAPQPLTPLSALAALEDPTKSSQEPADSAQPAKRRKSAAAEPQPKMIFTPFNTAKASQPALPKQTAPASEDDGFRGVADPVVGEIYQAYYKDATQEGWWMCTPLPWDAWERQIGINFSFDKLALWTDLPEDQYNVDRVRAKPGRRRTKKVITGWKGEFQAGGSKMKERIFPVLMFDDVEGEPGNFQFPADSKKSFTFSQKALKALPTEWIAAENLRMPGADVGGPVGGRDTAQRFRERLEARKALREKKMLGTPEKSRAVGSFGSAVASSPMEGSSALEASSLVEDASREDTSRDDTEMADAESLSGATAVEGDTAGQPYVLETPKILAAKAITTIKSSPTTKTTPAAEPAQSRSDKGWRYVVFG